MASATLANLLSLDSKSLERLLRIHNLTNLKKDAEYSLYHLSLLLEMDLVENRGVSLLEPTYVLTQRGRDHVDELVDYANRAIMPQGLPKPL